MKTLSRFLVESRGNIPPILVNVEPVHGRHSNRKRLDEETERPVKEYNIKDFYEPNPENIKDIESELDAHYPRKYLEDNRDERNAINNYTSGSRSLNMALIKHANRDWSGPHPFETTSNSWAKSLDNIMDSHKLPRNLTVYSGTGFDPDEFAKNHPDREIHLPAYTSTAIDPQWGAEFSKPIAHITTDGKTIPSDDAHDLGKHSIKQTNSHILKIKLPEGHPGYYVGSKGSLANEKELLLPRGMILRIPKKPTIYRETRPNYDIRKHPDHVYHYHVWDAEPLGIKR